MAPQEEMAIVLEVFVIYQIDSLSQIPLLRNEKVELLLSVSLSHEYLRAGWGPSTFLFSRSILKAGSADEVYARMAASRISHV